MNKLSVNSDCIAQTTVTGCLGIIWPHSRYRVSTCVLAHIKGASILLMHIQANRNNNKKKPLWKIFSFDIHEKKSFHIKHISNTDLFTDAVTTVNVWVHPVSNLLLLAPKSNIVTLEDLTWSITVKVNVFRQQLLSLYFVLCI